MPATYRMLRELGFEGVAMTDSLDVVRGHAREWAVAAARAGADLLLFTSGRDAARAIRVLLPLARSGELDDQVQRVLRFRAGLG
jgi:beta-N-acetylhexosaminidase